MQFDAQTLAEIGARAKARLAEHGIETAVRYAPGDSSCIELKGTVRDALGLAEFVRTVQISEIERFGWQVLTSRFCEQAHNALIWSGGR